MSIFWQSYCTMVLQNVTIGDVTVKHLFEGIMEVHRVRTHRIRSCGKKKSLRKVKLTVCHFSFREFSVHSGAIKILRSQLSLMPSHRAKRQKVEFRIMNVGRTWLTKILKRRQIQKCELDTVFPLKICQ